MMISSEDQNCFADLIKQNLGLVLPGPVTLIHGMMMEKFGNMTMEVSCSSSI